MQKQTWDGKETTIERVVQGEQLIAVSHFRRNSVEGSNKKSNPILEHVSTELHHGERGGHKDLQQSSLIRLRVRRAKRS